jgi:hypothetical protein
MPLAYDLTASMSLACKGTALAPASVRFGRSLLEAAARPVAVLVVIAQ